MAETRTQPIIRVGDENAIPLGQGRCYVVGDEQIAVFRQRDGRVFAAENRCPHRRGPLAEGLVGANLVICPLHAHRFDLETGEGSEPGECLRIYEASVIDGAVVLTDDLAD